MIFAFERIARNRPYPNLGQLDAMPGTPAWYQFSRTWPYAEPWQFWEYMLWEKIPDIHARAVADLGGQPAWYPIALTFFDYDIDYLDLIPIATRNLIRVGQIKVLFYYSEGDNPQRIRDHLDYLCCQHDLSVDSVHVVTANSACDSIPSMSYLADDELLYRLRNKHSACQWNPNHRSKSTTALVRTHKTWRAWTMAHLWQKGLDENSWFSYDCSRQDPLADQGNPLEASLIPGIENLAQKFLLAGPFRADDFTSERHNHYNDGHLPAHFQDSYLNIVIETHMDVDQSGGVFLTEKTFKPIKHCQPFVIFGAAGSLAVLKSLGYRTFDQVIDPAYDSIQSTTQRWLCLQATIDDLYRRGLHNVAQACRSDCEHNQQIFLASKQDRLNSLLRKLQHDHQ